MGSDSSSIQEPPASPVDRRQVHVRDPLAGGAVVLDLERQVARARRRHDPFGRDQVGDGEDADEDADLVLRRPRHQREAPEPLGPELVVEERGDAGSFLGSGRKAVDEKSFVRARDGEAPDFVEDRLDGHGGNPERLVGQLLARRVKPEVLGGALQEPQRAPQELEIVAAEQPLGGQSREAHDGGLALLGGVSPLDDVEMGQAFRPDQPVPEVGRRRRLFHGLGEARDQRVELALLEIARHRERSDEPVDQEEPELGKLGRRIDGVRLAVHAQFPGGRRERDARGLRRERRPRDPRLPSERLRDLLPLGIDAAEPHGRLEGIEERERRLQRFRRERVLGLFEPGQPRGAGGLRALLHFRQLEGAARHLGVEDHLRAHAGLVDRPQPEHGGGPAVDPQPGVGREHPVPDVARRARGELPVVGRGVGHGPDEARRRGGIDAVEDGRLVLAKRLLERLQVELGAKDGGPGGHLAGVGREGFVDGPEHFPGVRRQVGALEGRHVPAVGGSLDPPAKRHRADRLREVERVALRRLREAFGDRRRQPRLGQHGVDHPEEVGHRERAERHGPHLQGLRVVEDELEKRPVALGPDRPRVPGDGQRGADGEPGIVHERPEQVERPPVDVVRVVHQEQEGLLSGQRLEHLLERLLAREGRRRKRPVGPPRGERRDELRVEEPLLRGELPLEGLDRPGIREEVAVDGREERAARDLLARRGPGEAQERDRRPPGPADNLVQETALARPGVALDEEERRLLVPQVVDELVGGLQLDGPSQEVGGRDRLERPPLGEPASPRLSSREQGPGRGLEKRLRRGPVLGKRGDPGRDRRVGFQLLGLRQEGRIVEGRDEPLDEGRGLVAGPAREDQRERVAAVAGERVAGGRGRPDPLREVLQQPVPAGPAQVLVDPPEPLEVEQDEGGGRPGVARLQHLEQGPPVVEAREVVLDRERSVIFAPHSHDSILASGRGDANCLVLN
jgi:hypothetical protein